jgi:hypothetical protein
MKSYEPVKEMLDGLQQKPEGHAESSNAVMGHIPKEVRSK